MGSGASCVTPPTRSAKIPTGCPSCGLSGSSAVTSPRRRTFPPEHRKRALTEAIAEINERRTKGRRNRTTPRVIRRARHNCYIVKKPHHRGTVHHRPPTIHLYGPALNLVVLHLSVNGTDLTTCL